MTDKKTPADLSGAYALNALDAQEAAEFEEHLAGSERARVEAAELSDTAVALGLAVAPVQPSAGLKSSLMARLATTPQLPPLPKPESAAAPSAAPPAVTDASAPVTPTASAQVPPTAAAPVTPSTDATTPAGASAPLPGTTSSATKRAETRWFHRPARLVLAAAAAFALFVGGTFMGQAFNSNEFVEQQTASLAQINAAPDSARASATTVDGHEATLVWSNTLGLSALLVNDLPALPSDQDYQLWYINAAGAAPAGTFDSSGEGTVWRVLEGTMHAGDQVGVTVEPNGGSDEPTSNPIIAFQS